MGYSLQLQIIMGAFAAASMAVEEFKSAKIPISELKAYMLKSHGEVIARIEVPTGTTIEVASADRARHRLPRGGDRQLNLALHIIALTQVRMRHSTGRAYYDTKIACGKSHNEAMRCLKRRLADHVWRLMVRDERTQTAGPGGHSGASLQSSAAGSTPTASSSDKSLPEPAEYNSTTQRSVA